MRLIALSTAALLSASVFGASSQVAQAAPQKETKQASAQMVTIKPGDSLSKIAKTEDSTSERLFYANKDIENPDLIFPGDELRVPTKDEELEARPMSQPVAAEPAAAPTQPVAPAPAPQPATPVRSAPRTAPVQAAPVASGSVWDQLAACESGGNWSINTGNGYYGGIQFSLSSWQAVGGSGLPSDASREEQIQRGEALKAIQGWGAWPACTAKLGLR